MREFLANHQGPERGWVGQWEHVRGDDKTADGRLKMGREGWFKETLSFYDQYLYGIEPMVRYPAYSVESSNGAWRAEENWPAEDASATFRLGGGTYMDDGGGSTMKALDPSGKLTLPKVMNPSGDDSPEGASAPVPTAPKGLAEAQARHQKEGATTSGFFVWSAPTRQAVRVTGPPRISMTAKGEGNVMVKLYDVAKDGTAVMFDEQVSRLDRDRLNFELKPTDWTLAVGHVLAVEVGSVRTGDWLDTPAKQKVQAKDARLTLGLDDPSDDVATGGGRSPYLDTYLGPYSTRLQAGQAEFALPPVRDHG